VTAGFRSPALAVPENEQGLEFYRRNRFTETGAIDGAKIVRERPL